MDALAIAIGTSHGAYKFTRPPTGDILAIERIKAIHKRIPNTHLVMHGSSSEAAGMAQDDQHLRRRHGPDLWRAGGRDAGYQARRTGVNIDTDLRMSRPARVRKFLAENKEGIRPGASGSPPRPRA